MSLTGWLGSAQTVKARSLSPLLKQRTHTRIVLGVFGTRNSIRPEDLDANILAPMIATWGTPDIILLPAEGDSSFAIESWAQLKGIPTNLVSCDWASQGRRAGLLRDSRIQREATHFLLLQGPRSNALSTMAKRLHRKGHPVLISERPNQPAVDCSTINVEKLAPI